MMMMMRGFVERVIKSPQPRCRSAKQVGLQMSSEQWWANNNRDWDLNHDLNHFGDSIWDEKIWFEKLRFDLLFDLKILRFDLKNSYIASNRNNSHSILPKQESRDYIIYGANKPPGLPVPTDKYSSVGVPRLLHKAYGCRPMTDKDATLSNVGVSSMQL